MWYVLAAKGMVTLYHGTSYEDYLLMRASGVLKHSDSPNLSIYKNVSKSWAASFNGPDEQLVVLTFVVPVELVDWKPGANVAVGVGDIPMKYCKKVEKFTPEEKVDPSELTHQMNMKNLSKGEMSDPNNPGHERQIQDKLKELQRNPTAYIPAWMRNDSRLKRFLR